MGKIYSNGWCMGANLEAVWASLASHALLAHTGYHLCNVDGRAFAATLAHVQRAVVPVQRVHTHLHKIQKRCCCLAHLQTRLLALEHVSQQIQEEERGEDD